MVAKNEDKKTVGFCLTKDQIAAAQDLPMEKVFVPEWADGNLEAYVMVKGLTASERGVFENSLITPESKDTAKPVMNMTMYGPALAAFCMCSDDGVRLFTAGDVDMLAGKSMKAMDRVIKKAMQLNGIFTGAVEAAAKNS